jgi:hypothetical protein
VNARKSGATVTQSPAAPIDDESASLASSTVPATPPRRLQDIISDVLPAQQLHLIAGAPGAGKTAFVFWLLAQLRDGKKVFGLETRKPAFIGFIASDRTWDSHERWAQTVGYADIPKFSVVDDPTLSLEKLDDKKVSKHVEFLRMLIQKCNGGEDPPRDSLLILDPISLFIGGDMNRYLSVFRHMIEISQMCKAQGWTILATAHASKQKGSKDERYVRPQDRILGTAAFLGCAGTVCYLATPEETEDEIDPEFTWAPHHAPMATMRLFRNPKTGLLTPGAGATVVPLDVARADKKAKEAERESRPPRVSEEMEKFLNLFHEAEYKPLQWAVTEAMNQFGFSKPTLYRWKDQLKKAGRLVEGKQAHYRRVDDGGEEGENVESVVLPEG